MFAKVTDTANVRSDPKTTKNSFIQNSIPIGNFICKQSVGCGRAFDLAD